MGKINAAAVICEYNPFHNGHMYHISETRRISGADYIICVMSGDFVQRGEPAVISKWARAEMALRCGADIVAELPLPYSISSAQYFADGAVDTICKMSVISHISFGAESCDIIEAMAEEASGEAALDKSLMEKGASYTAASRTGGINAPNDVLAAEYIRALKRRGSDIKAVPISRYKTGHDTDGSALYIRRLILHGKEEDMAEIKALMPEASFDILQREMREGTAPVSPYALEQAVFACLRMLGPEGIRRAAPVSEGLEYKIYSAACEAKDYGELIDMCTSLRYTASRIRRCVLAAVLGVERKHVLMGAPYIRILGMRKKSGAFMEELRAQSAIPVITSKAKFIKYAGPDESGHTLRDAREFLDLQGRGADIYALAFPEKGKRNGHSDLTHPLVYV